MTINEFAVHFQWDDNASVWIATSKDIPGLVLESESLDRLIDRVRIAIPELLRLNESELEMGKKSAAATGGILQRYVKKDQNVIGKEHELFAQEIARKYSEED